MPPSASAPACQVNVGQVANLNKKTCLLAHRNRNERQQRQWKLNYFHDGTPSLLLSIPAAAAVTLSRRRLRCASVWEPNKDEAQTKEIMNNGSTSALLIHFSYERRTLRDARKDTQLCVTMDGRATRKKVETRLRKNNDRYLSLKHRSCPAPFQCVTFFVLENL